MESEVINGVEYGCVGQGFRKRVELFGENFYLTVTKGKEIVVDCTVPFENRPERLNERLVVETMCREMTELLNRGNHEV